MIIWVTGKLWHLWGSEEYHCRGSSFRSSSAYINFSRYSWILPGIAFALYLGGKRSLFWRLRYQRKYWIYCVLWWVMCRGKVWVVGITVATKIDDNNYSSFCTETPRENSSSETELDVVRTIFGTCTYAFMRQT